jgi:predicted tellurium resistance membrane protein TerC
LTLTVLELVLGIDNIIFIAILSGKLPPTEQKKARTIGLSLVMLTRILLLLSIWWIVGLTRPLFNIGTLDVTARTLILLSAGLFLFVKSTHEIHDRIEGGEEQGKAVDSGVPVFMFDSDAPAGLVFCPKTEKMRGSCLG